jgi:hypothetical protein
MFLVQSLTVAARPTREVLREMACEKAAPVSSSWSYAVSVGPGRLPKRTGLGCRLLPKKQRGEGRWRRRAGRQDGLGCSSLGRRRIDSCLTTPSSASACRLDQRLPRPRARAWPRSTVIWHLIGEQRLGDAQLLLSELVANAVKASSDGAARSACTRPTRSCGSPWPTAAASLTPTRRRRRATSAREAGACASSMSSRSAGALSAPMTESACGSSSTGPTQAHRFQ